MATSPNYKHTNGKVSRRRDGDESLLPLAVRQRLWDQIWARLLAPPVEAGDRAPTPKPVEYRKGGTR